jgi:hypothetical protein
MCQYFGEKLEGKRVLNIQFRKITLPSMSTFNLESYNVITLP